MSRPEVTGRKLPSRLVCERYSICGRTLSRWEQATELDPKKREATLHRIQQLIHDKVIYLPMLQLALLQAYGPRVEQSGLGLIDDYPWSAPYEELGLKDK